MRKKRTIPFAFTNDSIKAAAFDLENSIKNKNGKLLDAGTKKDDSGTTIGFYYVDEKV